MFHVMPARAPLLALLLLLGVVPLAPLLRDTSRGATATSQSVASASSPSDPPVAGTITEFSVPKAGYTIATGPDGNLWFEVRFEPEDTSSRIGCMTTAGAVTLFPTGDLHPGGIAAGADGALWVAGGDRIGRITVDGVVTNVFMIPNTRYYAWEITSGPDGKSAFGNLTSWG